MADEKELQVLAREKARQEAMIKADWAALSDLISDDYVHIHTTGIIHDKAQLLAHVQGGLQFVSIERRDVSIRVFDDIAIMHGVSVNTVKGPKGPEHIVVEAISTQTWRLENRVWREVHFQATKPTPHVFQPPAQD